MIKMTESFYFRNHLCIVMELLSINLYELIKANSFAGFSTRLIRRFTTQVLASLSLMRHHRIVHCDLKPEVSDACAWQSELVTAMGVVSADEYLTIFCGFGIVEYFAQTSSEERDQGHRFWF